MGTGIFPVNLCCKSLVTYGDLKEEPSVQAVIQLKIQKTYDCHLVLSYKDNEMEYTITV